MQWLPDSSCTLGTLQQHHLQLGDMSLCTLRLVHVMLTLPYFSHLMILIPCNSGCCPDSMPGHPCIHSGFHLKQSSSKKLISPFTCFTGILIGQQLVVKKGCETRLGKWHNRQCSMARVSPLPLLELESLHGLRFEHIFVAPLEKFVIAIPGRQWQLSEHICCGLLFSVIKVSAPFASHSTSLSQAEACREES